MNQRLPIWYVEKEHPFWQVPVIIAYLDLIQVPIQLVAVDWQEWDGIHRYEHLNEQDWYLSCSLLYRVQKEVEYRYAIDAVTVLENRALFRSGTNREDE